MESQRIIYLIKWTRGEKPFYQMGEIIALENNKYIPTPPEIYLSLNIIFQAIKNKFHSSALVLITRGFEQNEIEYINEFIKRNSFIKKYRHLAKPIGRKPDGSPYRIFMIDDDINSMKEIRKIVLKEHFEIIGIAKTANDAIRLVSKNYRHIDIIIIEVLLPDLAGYEVIKQLKALKTHLKIIVVTKSKSNNDVEKAVNMRLNGYIVKPVKKEILLSKLKWD